MLLTFLANNLMLATVPASPSTGSGVGRNKYPKPNTYHPITFVPDYRQAKREDDELIEILKAITKIL